MTTDEPVQHPGPADHDDDTDEPADHGAPQAPPVNDTEKRYGLDESPA